MREAVRKRVRLQQTQREFDHLREGMKEDLDHWKKAKLLKNHTKQLGELKSVVDRALSQLELTLQELDLNRGAITTATLYDRCTGCDRSLIWIGLVWDYYREKMEQRLKKDSGLESFLEAADEVAWSCYATVFGPDAQLTHGLEGGPCPLPYLTLGYTPLAVPRDKPPAALHPARLDVETMLHHHAFLSRLPVPVVGLPMTSVQSPWSLVFLAHEVGHHVQYDLAPRQAMIKSFGDLVAQVVQTQRGVPIEAGTTDVEARRWREWSQELFADLFSVLTLGPWALWGLAEALRTNEASLLTEPAAGSQAEEMTRYPAPVVRLGLLAIACRTLGVESAAIKAALAGLDIEALVAPRTGAGGAYKELRDQARADLALGERVVPALLDAPLVAEQSLQQLCAWDAAPFSPGGEVMWWQTKLSGTDVQLEETPALATPRFVMGGGMAAWDALCDSFGDARPTDEKEKEQKQRQQDFAVRLYAAIIANREPGTRAVSNLADKDIVALGQELFELAQHD